MAMLEAVRKLLLQIVDNITREPPKAAPPALHEFLRELAKSGGSIEVVEGYYPYSFTERLRATGLADCKPAGGGWGYTEEYYLTEQGRRRYGKT